MEIKKTQSRGRPKKDFGELKSKLAVEAAENKGKLSRGRPKKQRTIDDSINTKIYNSRKDILNLENKNTLIHNNINFQNTDIGSKKSTGNPKDEYSQLEKKILYVSIIIFVLCVLWFAISKIVKNKELVFSEITQNLEDNEDGGKNLQMQIGYNNENGDFVEIENIDINNSIEGNVNLTSGVDETIDDEGISVDEIIMESETNIDEQDLELINLFYSKINNKEFSELASLADSYLKKSNEFRTYFSTNWLTNFIDKVVGNKIFVGNFKEIPNDKPNVKKYRYTIKYKVIGKNGIIKEEWEMSIVNRNGRKEIGSIMCVTTGCSKMPFFQK